MEHNLPAHYWQWSSPAASTAGCEDSGFSLCQRRPHSHFQAFQVQTDHRLLCIRGRSAHQFSVKGIHRFLQPGVCTQACSIFPATFCWPAHAQSLGFGCTPWGNPCGGRSLLSTERGKAFLLGWAFLQQQKAPHHGPPLPTSTSHSQGKHSPWPFVSSSLCFLFPEFLHLKKAQISAEISLHSGNLCSAPCIGGAMSGVCGFKPTISQVSSANPSTELSSQFQGAYEFYLTCCQYFELSAALERSLLSSRLFPRINRAQWHTELSHLAGIQWVSPYE